MQNTNKPHIAHSKNHQHKCHSYNNCCISVCYLVGHFVLNTAAVLIRQCGSAATKDKSENWPNWNLLWKYSAVLHVERNTFARKWHCSYDFHEQTAGRVRQKEFEVTAVAIAATTTINKTKTFSEIFVAKKNFIKLPKTLPLPVEQLTMQIG